MTNSRYHQLHPPRFLFVSIIARTPATVRSSILRVTRASCRPHGLSGHEVDPIANRLELETHARGRGDVGRMVEITVRLAVLHTGVHHAGVDIEALGQTIVRIEGQVVRGAAAASGYVGAAAGIRAGGVAILLVTVVCGCQ